LATGLALAVGLSPALWNLVGHWGAAPWSRYSILFLPVLAALSWRESTGGGPEFSSGERSLWTAGVVLSLGIELLAIAGGLPSLARIALPLAAVGGLRLALGLSPRDGILAFWVIPLPHALLAITSPWLEETWGALARQILGPGSAGSAPLVLGPADGGQRLVATFVGLAWALGAWRREAPGPRLGRMLRWGMLGAGLQLPVLLLALLLADQGHVRAARMWLDQAVWIAGALGLFAAMQPLRRSSALGRGASAPGG